MSDPPQQTKPQDQPPSDIASWLHSNRSLVRLVTWIYTLVILWDALDYQPPAARADRSQVTYEVYALILGLLPLILAALLKNNSRAKLELQKIFPASYYWTTGFFLAICAVTLKNAYTLSLQFLLPYDATASFYVEAAILALKWSGLGMMAWAQLQTFRQKIAAGKTDEAKRKSQILYGLVVVVLIVLIAFFAWQDISRLVASWP